MFRSSSQPTNTRSISTRSTFPSHTIDLGRIVSRSLFGSAMSVDSSLCGLESVALELT